MVRVTVLFIERAYSQLLSRIGVKGIAQFGREPRTALVFALARPGSRRDYISDLRVHLPKFTHRRESRSLVGRGSLAFIIVRRLNGTLNFDVFDASLALEQPSRPRVMIMLLQASEHFRVG